MHLRIKSDACNYMETQFFLKDFYTLLCVNPQEPADRHTKRFTCASGAEVLQSSGFVQHQQNGARRLQDPGV